VRLDLAGYPVIVTDTAGIREAQGRIEAEGIRRALAHARDADVVVWLLDASAEVFSPPPQELESGGELILVANKIDLGGEKAVPAGALPLSAKTGAGIDALTRRLGDIAARRVGAGESPAITRARYREHLGTCLTALGGFMTGVHDGVPGVHGAMSAVHGAMPAVHDHLELRAEELRTAIAALGRITGRVDVEEVLGEIFGRFCIGK
jgi:tRNA modification GTPase